MELQFDKDIILFRNLKPIEIIKKNPLYRLFYKPILENWILETGFNTNKINKIHIIHNKTSYGTAIPNIINKCFDIEISDEILLYVSKNQDSTETFKSKSVFQHEIFHCIEMDALLSSNALTDDWNVFQEDFHVNTTKNFLVDESIKLWSEFYACYNNFKINFWHEVPNIGIDIKQIDKWIKATHTYIKNSKTEDIKLCEDMLKDIHKFWYDMVSIIAVYIQNKEPLLKKEFSDMYNEFPYLEKYFDLVYTHLNKLIQTYPMWISEKEYITFGKILFQILDMNNIVFSTEDLSDNFIFKLKE